MDAFLKGFYGYKNFGDEMLFFGLVNWINENYDISKLVVESGNNLRFEEWIKDNKDYLGSVLDKLEIVSINPYRIKHISHALNLLGLGKYRRYFKFFGGGEVLDDSRKFPHDGRNITLLYNRSIRKKRFILLGGVGSIKKNLTKILYALILSRAKNIICREKVSYHISCKYNHQSVLYQDFSLDILKRFLQNTADKKTKIQEYILINVTPRSRSKESVNKIQKFCEEYPRHKKIFFPCDLNDDSQYFTELKKTIPDIEIYNWTKHSLNETLQLFYKSDAGIGARLHFLYPLKIFEKKHQALVYEEKIEKMLV